MKLVDLLGLHVETTTGSPIVLLREHDDPHRLLPIFVGGSEAASIGVALSGEAPPRPLTHDAMVEILRGLGASVERAQVTSLSDGTFDATITVAGPTGESPFDVRPSDAIALAIRFAAPVFVSDDVLDEAGAVPPEELGGDQDDEPQLDGQQLDAEQVDEEVARFRSFLEDIDPTDFGDGTGSHGDAGGPGQQGDEDDA